MAAEVSAFAYCVLLKVVNMTAAMQNNGNVFLRFVFMMILLLKKLHVYVKTVHEN